MRYERIAPTVEALERRPDFDPSRPPLEVYRSHDVIDVVVPAR